MSPDTTIASCKTSYLEIAVPSQPQLAQAWEDLGDSYQQRFENIRNLDLLNNAIVVYRHTLELWSKDGSHLTCMYHLANAVQNRFEKTGSLADLEEAISMFRELLFLHPAPHPNRSISLVGLAYSLRDRFRWTGSVTDLEEAISILRESLSLCPAPHPNRLSSLHSLASVLDDRFRNTDSMTDLEEAISLFRDVPFLIHIVLYHSTTLQLHLSIVLKRQAQ